MVNLTGSNTENPRVINVKVFCFSGKPIFSIDIHPDGSRFATGGQGEYISVIREKIYSMIEVGVGARMRCLGKWGRSNQHHFKTNQNHSFHKGLQSCTLISIY